MTYLSICLIVLPVAAIINQWRIRSGIRSGYYKKIKLLLKERLFWAFICIILPAIEFMSKPNLFLGIVICIIFICILLYGSRLEKTSEHRDP